MSEHSKPIVTARPAGRGLKIALALSLAVNLAVVGLIAGAAIGFGPNGDRDDPRLRALGLGPFAMALSREDRAGFATRIDRAALRAERRALGEGLSALGQALRAEPFDRAAAGAALARMRDATETLQSISHDALLDQIAQMPATERAALADRFARALRRMGGHRDAR
ncbi:periplasmic heavy metal sensor [Roseicyclus sp.]|uniref:periplasmic heavy metal sensor n=1 Tax=Roseicyclus sp. TaxID=1914329 RepID=UPI003F6D6C03